MVQWWLKPRQSDAGIHILYNYLGLSRGRGGSLGRKKGNLRKENDHSNFPVGWCLSCFGFASWPCLYVHQAKVLKFEWALESPRRLVEYKCPLPPSPPSFWLYGVRIKHKNWHFLQFDADTTSYRSQFENNWYRESWDEIRIENGFQIQKFNGN